jgi:hypothetical protein
MMDKNDFGDELYVSGFNATTFKEGTNYSNMAALAGYASEISGVWSRFQMSRLETVSRPTQWQSQGFQSGGGGLRGGYRRGCTPSRWGSGACAPGKIFKLQMRVGEF